jgi:hypothetical protein
VVPAVRVATGSALGAGVPVNPLAGVGVGVAVDPLAGAGVAVNPLVGTGVTVDPLAGAGVTTDPLAGAGVAVDPLAGAGVDSVIGMFWPGTALETGVGAALDVPTAAKTVRGAAP